MMSETRNNFQKLAILALADKFTTRKPLPATCIMRTYLAAECQEENSIRFSTGARSAL